MEEHNYMRRQIMPEILVVALNPSIDVEWRVADVRWEEKNSIVGERRWAGGKGVNVARWLKHLGAQPGLLLPVGGTSGHELIHRLKSDGLPARVVTLREQTRANVIVTTAQGRQLRFNPLGPIVSGREWQQIQQVMRVQVRSAKLAVFSGSLPRGVPSDAYGQLISSAKAAGVSCILDCDGPAFGEGIQAQPFFVKPNLHELEQWFGRNLRSRKEIRDAALALSSVSRNWVLVSRGERGGMLVNSELKKVFESAAPGVEVINTVGAGDAMLAGAAKALSENKPPDEWLQWGVGCGTAAASCRAGILPPHKMIKRIVNKTRLSNV